jgi:non-ribosomal peptide synthetase-like protein
LLRLMGITVGTRTEISTATGLSPLVSFGAYSQSTDDIGFCGVRARDGWIHLAPVSVGDRTFLGPGSILRGGTELGDDSLVGVLTLCPPNPEDGTSWFGVPALELPRIPEFADDSRTMHPPRRLVAVRTIMDTLRLFGPNTVVLLLDACEMYGLGLLAAHLGLLVAILLAPFVLIVAGIVATAITVALKWIVIGRYKPGEHPLWSWFVWRDELINSTQEQLAGEKLLGASLGTPLMAVYLRAMGATIGQGCWLESLAVTEYEMINLGDGVSVNRGACLMTHLFHDRLLRIGDTHLQSGASLGPTAAVLPDTVVGAGTVIEAHSVVLRGEELPPLTRWQGAPVAAR